MKSVDKIFKLAERFSQKISLAQSGQAGDIQRNLHDAGLWDITNDIFPLLDQVNIPSKVVVSISIGVDPSFNVTFPVKTADMKKGQQLSQLLSAKYGQQMSQALSNGTVKDSFGKVIGPLKLSQKVVVPWQELK